MVSPAQTVLVIDDNKTDRELIAALIGGKYRVIEASNVASGIELYRAERPDCVLLDHQMPGTAGLDAIRGFTEEDAVVIMLTGDGSDALAAEAFKRGARDYVLKGGLNRNMLERIVSREMERRHLELDLQTAQAELRLSQKLEAIGQLAAGVAHEINTPLQYIGDNIQFLASGISELIAVFDACSELFGEGEDVAPDALRRLRSRVIESDLRFFAIEASSSIAQASEGIGHIKNIVSAMKELSHPRDEMQRIDLNHTIDNVVTVARSEWKYVAEVVLDLDAKLPPIACYPSEINQAALNLLVNAAQAIGEVVKLGEKGEIRIRTTRDADHVVLTIEDSGCGIPGAIRDRIFDPFFTTKAIGKGTGQGLAITHRIVVDHHRGDIEVSSEPGKGTCFAVRLPIDGGVYDQGRSDE